VKLKIKSRHFGELEFDEGIVYHFADGLPGFEELRNFIIIDDKDTEPFRWLLSIDDPAVGFALLEAKLVAPELYGEFPPAETSSSVVFVIAILGRDPERLTANLRAPVLISQETRSGKQVVLNSDKYETDHRII